MRVAVVWLSPWFDWPQALTVVPPETFRRWRHHRLRLFWQGLLCLGRPPILVERHARIRQIARDHLTWGQRRMAHEWQLKLGLQVSPRTVRTYLPTHLDRAPGHRVPVQRWRTVVRHHAWDLIVRGVAVDVIRGVQVLSRRLIQFPQRWWRHAVSTVVHGSPQGHTAAVLLLRASMSVPVAWSMDMVEVIRVDQRRPPNGGPSYTHDH